MQPPPPALARAIGVTNFANAAYQTLKIRKIVAIKNAFPWPGPEHNFRFAAKTGWLAGQPCPRKFQAMTAEGNLGGRHDSNFNFRHQRLDQRHWGREARKNFGFVRTTH